VQLQCCDGRISTRPARLKNCRTRSARGERAEHSFFPLTFIVHMSGRRPITSLRGNVRGASVPHPTAPLHNASSPTGHDCALEPSRPDFRDHTVSQFMGRCLRIPNRSPLEDLTPSPHTPTRKRPSAAGPNACSSRLEVRPLSDGVGRAAYGMLDQFSPSTSRIVWEGPPRVLAHAACHPCSFGFALGYPVQSVPPFRLPHPRQPHVFRKAICTHYVSNHLSARIQYLPPVDPQPANEHRRRAGRAAARRNLPARGFVYCCSTALQDSARYLFDLCMRVCWTACPHATSMLRNDQPQ